MIHSSDSSDDSKDSSSSSEDDSDEGPSVYKNQQLHQGTCKLCHGDKHRNKDGKREQLVRCAKCRADGQFRFKI